MIPQGGVPMVLRRVVREPAPSIIVWVLVFAFVPQLCNSSNGVVWLEQVWRWDVPGPSIAGFKGESSQRWPQGNGLLSVQVPAV